MDLLYSQSLLSWLLVGATAQQVPGKYRKELMPTSFKGLAGGAGVRAALSRDRNADRHHGSLPFPHPAGRCRQVPKLTSPW